ncbi:MAG: hypothetical protein QM232_05525 [Bacteroidota bacterium]|nr:hypothetical protein [Bacteroidota bacterium]
MKNKELIASLGKKGNEMVRKEFSLDKMSAGLAEVYNNVMQ